MASLVDLHRAVQATLASKRLGQPVFVRYTLQTQDEPKSILPRLAQTAAVVREWLGQPLASVYATGSTDSGHVSVTLQFTNGASAQVSYARSQAHGDGVDLMVLGNHGAMYHDAGAAELWDEPAAAAGLETDAPLQSVIEKSLRSGKPESVEKGGKP